MQKYVRTWQNKGHRPYWAHIHVQMCGPKFKELVGFEYKNPIYIVDSKGHNSSYFTESEINAATQYFSDYWNNPSKVKEYFDIIDDFFKRAEKIEKKCINLDWKSISVDEIISLLKKLEDFCCFRYIFITNPPHTRPIDDKLDRLLSGIWDKNKLIASLSLSDLPLPFDKELQKINVLRNKWHNLSQKEKNNELNYLVRKFGWFGGIEGEKEYDKEHYLNEITIKPTEIRVKKSRPSASLKISKEVKDLCMLIAKLSYTRMWCRYHGMTIRYCIKLGIKELEKRWKVKDLLYAILPEIYNYYQKCDKAIFLNIEGRKKGYVAKLQDGKAIIKSGIDKNYYERIVGDKILIANTVIGMPANPGLVKGNARIISFTSEKYHDEIKSFQKGEILVTGMTRPQIAHLCQKAKAIVTDEGGITSHAAVISREFNIPCVIGTQNATKIFKSGDLIEVDAKKGVVRKL